MEDEAKVPDTPHASAEADEAAARESRAPLDRPHITSTADVDASDAPAPAPLALPADATPSDVLDDANIHDLALMVLEGVRNRRELAMRCGVGEATVKRLMATQRFQNVYEQRREEFYGDLGKVMRDERATPLLRRRALVQRADTLLANILDTIQDRIEEGTVALRKDGSVVMDDDGEPVLVPANASELRVGVAAATEVDRRLRAIEPKDEKREIAVFIPSPSQAATIQEALDDVGIDMATVLDAEFAPVDDADDDADAAEPAK